MEKACENLVIYAGLKAKMKGKAHFIVNDGKGGFKIVDESQEASRIEVTPSGDIAHIGASGRTPGGNVRQFFNPKSSGKLGSR